MLSIKTKLKINKIKQTIDSIICKIGRFIFKPLVILEEKIRKSKRKRIEKKANELTYGKVVKLLAENIINKFAKYPKSCETFLYKYEYDGDNVLTYLRNSSNEILRIWSYRIDWKEEQNTNDILMELLKQELLKYPEIEFYDYQKDKYSYKTLTIKLKEGEN